MTEKEAYVRKWAASIAKEREELGGFSVCPYASGSKTKVIECPVDDIEPISGFDVVVFIIDDMWDLVQVKQWVQRLNRQYPHWKFFEDCASQPTFINGIQTNNKKYNLILSQSRKKLRAFRKKLSDTEYYTYWTDEYLKEVVGDDLDLLKKSSNL